MPKTPTAIPSADAVAAVAPDTNEVATPEQIAAADAIPPAPPIDNAFVAPGAELFTSTDTPDANDEPSDFNNGTRKILAAGEHTVQTTIALPEGIELLGSVVADFNGWTRKILAAGEHTVQAVVAAPTRWEHAIALPLAEAGETLHEVEGLLIQSFRDAGDEIRKVYLNVHGMFVKA